MKNFNYRH